MPPMSRIDPGEITKHFLLDIFCIDKTKLDDSFPDHQFKIDGYQFPPFRRVRNNFGRGKIVYVKDGLIVKRLNDFQTNISETISSELTVSNKKWCMLAYRPPIENNNLTFFNEVNKAVNKYDNILITGDLNTYFSNSKIDINNCLSNFIDTFSLTNMVNSKTCFKTLNGTLLDIMLTNKTKYFCKTCTIETALSDYNKMITFLRASFKKIPSKNIVCRELELI